MRHLRLLSFAIAIFLTLFLVGCNLPHVLSYPSFWDYTKRKPEDNDLVGTYKLLKSRLPTELDRSIREKDFAITLNADRTAILTDVPKFDGFGDNLVCRLSGSATWALNGGTNGDWGWDITFNYHPATKPSAGECDHEKGISGFLVLSRHAPYRLYQSVGDPDSDTGVEYRRVDR